MAYVEVKAKTVEMAIEAAMRELGVTERDRLEIEVIQQPERGFLGFGGQDALVKVSERSGGRRGSRQRSRNRRKGGDSGESPASGSGSGRSQQSGGGRHSGGGQKSGSGGGRQEGSGGGRARSGSGGGGRNQSEGGGSQRGQGQKPRPQQSPPRPKEDDDRDGLDATEQEPLVGEFLTGLLESFGLEGEVKTRMDEDVVVANVVGDQTEALVGPRGSVMEAVHELTKTVLQRSVREPARVRIDIAGYAERRRQALTIYAGELISQVQSEGGELMLEPMSAADRKVIHDAAAAHEGIRSYSEGEAPTRYVVIAADTPSGSEEAGDAEPPVQEEIPAEEVAGGDEEE